MSLNYNPPANQSPRLLLLVCVLLLLSGCATALELKPTVDRLSSVTKFPLSVGIYYSPEFRSYDYGGCSQMRAYGTTLKKMILGEASVTLFERLFSLMFDNAITLESRQTLPSSKAKLSVIIEPDVDNIRCANFRTPNQGFGLRYTAAKIEITYHFALYSSNGEALGYWNVTGVGESEYFIERFSAEAKAAELAMGDAAKKIATEFREIPAVKRLLNEKK